MDCLHGRGGSGMLSRRLLGKEENKGKSRLREPQAEGKRAACICTSPGRTRGTLAGFGSLVPLLRKLPGCTSRRRRGRRGRGGRLAEVGGVLQRSQDSFTLHLPERPRCSSAPRTSIGR